MDLRSGPTIGTSRKAFWQLGPNRRSKCREWGPKRQAPGVGGCSLVFQRWNHLCHASAMQRLCGVMYLFIIWSDVKMHRQIDAHAAGFCVELKSCRSNLDTAKALKCRLTRPIEASNNHILENCESQYHFSSFFSQRYSLPSHMSLRRPTSRYPTSLYLVDDLIHKTTKFWTVFFLWRHFLLPTPKKSIFVTAIGSRGLWSFTPFWHWNRCCVFQLKVFWFYWDFCVWHLGTFFHNKKGGYLTFTRQS